MTDEEALIIAKQFLSEQKEIEDRDNFDGNMFKNLSPTFFDDLDDQSIIKENTMRKLLAEYLKTERLIKRMDHVDVCNVSGVSQSTMTRIENSHGNVTLENILAVLQTYELDEPLRVYLTKEIEVGKRILAQRNK